MPLEEDQVDLSGLYPGLDPDQLEEARFNLERYLDNVFSISKRQAKDVSPEAIAELINVQWGTDPNIKNQAG